MTFVAAERQWAAANNASYLPMPSANSIGGVESFAPIAHQFMTGISTSGVPLLGTPAFSDLSGVIGAAHNCPLHLHQA